MNLTHKILLALLLTLAWAGTSYAVGTPGPADTKNVYFTSAVATANLQVKATPGYVKYMVCIGEDAAAQAGSIILSDATAEDTTPNVVVWVVQAAYNYATPVIFPVERAFNVGIYLNFTADTDIACYVVYR